MFYKGRKSIEEKAKFRGLYDIRLSNQKNAIKIQGFLKEKFELVEIPGYNFGDYYKTIIISERKNGKKEDIVPIFVPKELIQEYLGQENHLKNRYVKVGGQLRSYDKYDQDGSRHLGIYVLAEFIKVYSESKVRNSAEGDQNDIYLDGYLCTEPRFSMSKELKSFTDFVIVCKDENEERAYVPITCREKAAEMTKNVKKGDRVAVLGKIQSRDYVKFQEDSQEYVERTCLEVMTFNVSRKAVE